MGDTHVLQAKENYQPSSVDHFSSVRGEFKELMNTPGLHTTRDHHQKTLFNDMFSVTNQNKELKHEMQQMEAKLQNKENQIIKLKYQLEKKETAFDEPKPHEKAVALTQRCTNKSPASGGDFKDAKVVRFSKEYDVKKHKEVDDENKILNREIERLRDSLKSIEDEKKSLKKQLKAAFENSPPDHRNRMSILEDERDELSRSNQTLKLEVERLSSEVSNFIDERFDMKKKYEDLKSCYDALETLTSNKFSDYSIESMPHSDMAKSTKENSGSKFLFGQNGKSRGEDSLSSIRANAELSDLSLPDCRKLISEILEIYKIKNPTHIITSIHKTEKVIQAIPRLRKLISDIAAIVLPRVGLEKDMDQIELIIPSIKKCFKELDEVEALTGMKKKLTKMLDLSKDCTNFEILKRVDQVLCIGYQSSEIKSQRSQRDTSDKTLAETFSKTFGIKPDSNVFKQINGQLEDLKHFTNLVKQKLSLNFTLKSETCLKYVLRLLENSMKDREAADIALKIQKSLNCKLDVLPAKVEELISERHKYNPYGFQGIH